MKLEFVFPKKVDKFFEKKSHLITKEDVKQLLIKSIEKLILKKDINIDVKKLKGSYKNSYRIRQNQIRIIFQIVNDVVIIKVVVENIDFRGDVYK